MSLVTMKELLIDAQKRKYAVGAFTVWNMEYTQGVLEAAEELKSPVIIMFGPVETRYAGKNGLEILSGVILSVIKYSKIPVVLHLDHSIEIELIRRAINSGFSSVMFDGSLLPYSENVRITKEVIALAHPKGISVEAEIGKVAGLEWDNNLLDSGENLLTSPGEALKFYEDTKVDALAVSIGTVHGLYKAKPKLDIERLKQIRKNVDVPLVLHGGSDTPDEQIKETILNGITKINIATELKLAYAKGVGDIFANNPEETDMFKILGSGRERIKKLVRQKIVLFGSENKI